MTEPETLTTFNGHDVYVMPMFATLEEPDLEAAIAWYQAALGFSAMFVARGPDGRPMLAHLRRAKYQDLLLVPGAAGDGERVRISLRADGDPAELAARARAAAPCGASAIEGPLDTPWNTTDVRITDPGGHKLVLTAQRSVPDPALDARMRAWLDMGKTS
jgi:catechol 2,3-dioxygenase-like lactoylglutathione lyase family enzyme